MERTKTRRSALSIEKIQRAKPNAWAKVFDERKRRVRGLWRRNGFYYAQLNVNGTPVRFKLHAATVPEAVTAQQALKSEQRAGTLKRPGEQPSPTPSANPGDHTIKEMLDAYRKERDELEGKDPKTNERENSGLNKWSKFAGRRSLGEVRDQLLVDYAKWRKKQKNRKGATISGRSIDLDVMSFRHALKAAVVWGWLEKMPVGKWKKLAKKPAKKRLIATEELTKFRKLAVDECPLRGQLFADYLGLLSYSGGREKETYRLEWKRHVHWKRRQLEFPGGKKGGGSHRAGEPRFIDFFPKLEAHLKAMYARRDKTSLFMFPSDDHPEKPVTTFKQIWKKVRQAAKIFGTDEDIGFHHCKHYFISHCVMAGIDFMTIAVWAAHIDGGILIGKVYGHLRPGHSANEATKLNNAAWN
ncbi:MAG TPA: tyrosine-type recombinase/integrase [Verrucomicrobiae bacterium]|jgi:site-specific recombinase XerD|nr:tyrosine-type recombinase/integrase [Verrucomicrobiae bacterium]